MVGVCLISLMYSCSGTPKEKQVTVSNVEISGFIKDYVKVVDGSYTFMHDGTNASITITVELVRDVPSYSKLGGWVSSKLNVIDENGNILEPYSGSFDLADSDKVADLLNSSVGSTKKLIFKASYFNIDNEANAKIFTNASTFEWIDGIFAANTDLKISKPTKPINNNSSGNNAINEPIQSSDSSSDWDAVLDDYEKYIDNYIKLLKKAKNGDLTAITESLDLMENAESLGNKLDNAKGDMSTNQLKRYMKLQKKLLSAAMQ